MRLLICDNKKINYFSLPEVVEDYFIINYAFNDLTEVINLVAIDGVWHLESDLAIQVFKDGLKLTKAPLNEYANYQLHFSGLNMDATMHVIPIFESFFDINFNNASKITIGSGKDCNIIYDDYLTHLLHASIIQDKDRFLISDDNTENKKIYINKRRIHSHVLQLGDVIFINGLKLIWMDTYIKINNPPKKVKLNGLSTFKRQEIDRCYYTPVTETERNVNLYSEDQLFFHTPRLQTEIKSDEVHIDAPPEEDHSHSMPVILTVGSSAIVGITSCITGISAVQGIITHSITPFEAILEFSMCILMLLACVAFPVISDRWERRQKKKDEQRRQKRYKEYLAQKVNSINDIIKKQEEVLHENNLTLDEIQKRIKNRSDSLWNREMLDNDFLKVRLGLGDIAADIKIEAPTEHFSLYDDNLKEEVLKIASEKRKTKNVPITISMVHNKITPFIINSNFKQNYIDSIMLQILFYYSALDLKIVLFTSEENEDKWAYLKYLPHLFSGDRTTRYFASSENEMVQLSLLLEQEYDKRIKATEQTDKEGTKKSEEDKLLYKNYSEYYLIITDDFKAVKNLSIVNRILNSNINIGFSIMIIEDSLQNLPSRLEKFVDIGNNISGLYSRELNGEGQTQFKAEYVPTIDMNEYANIIANIPIAIKDSESMLPTALKFLDMYNVGRVDQLNILSRWNINDPTTTLNAQVGINENGKPIGLDLHEKYHGPHGLIAGSTGSGKSEFIITYILSMAINYHPDEVQFVLIDYKGGGLAGAFENREKKVKIPHLIGTITNLDTGEMNRTLVSIKSEIQRRQRKFNEARDVLGESTIDIYKYQRLYRDGKVKEPISHLFVISDEFAELKQQQPDFMDELISTARIGRSLGVHLILATQKPAGVVDDQIWSNSRFKVCLKVQTVEDSIEMLKRPEASEIKESGRFYLQIGNDELFELGQSAWAGAKYIPVDRVLKKVNDSLDFINHDGVIFKRVNEEIKPSEMKDYGEQLTNIVQYLNDLANREKIKFNSLWLPNIPKEIYLGNLIKKYDYKYKAFYINPIVGEYDKPAKQEQGLYTLDLTCQNSIIFGSPGCGKENLLTTIVYSTCTSHSVDEVNFYILDFGSEVLNVFNRMPHVGSVISSFEKNKVAAEFEFLEREIRRRKELFADYAGSYQNYCKKSDKKLPLIVTILNSYESFMENCSEFDDYFSHLLRDGSKYGIVFVVTLVSTNAMRASLVEYFANKIILQASDSFDYQYILGAEHGVVPRKNFGRGMTIIGEEPCEFQTALIYLKEKVNDIIRDTSKNLDDAYSTSAPEIKTLPKTITVDKLFRFTKSIDKIPVGYSRDLSTLTYYDFSKTKTNFIIGNKVIQNNAFMNGIIVLLNTLPNVHINIFDMLGVINNEGNMSYYNLDYIEGFKDILHDNRANINIFIGIGDYSISFNQDNLTLFNQIITNIDNLKNQTFIFIDDNNRFGKFINTAWFKKVNSGSGIWCGDDIDSQEIFELNNLHEYDIDDGMKDKIYVIRNNEYIVVKGIGIEQEDLL